MTTSVLPVASSMVHAPDVSGTVRAGARVGQYAPADPVRLVATELGVSLATAAQYLKPSDDRCPFANDAIGVRMIRALVRGGRGDVAERLSLSYDLARVPLRPLLTQDLVADAQRTDLLEDIAENEARSFPSLESKRRWLKALEAQHAKDAEEIAALRQDCGL